METETVAEPRPLLEELIYASCREGSTAVDADTIPVRIYYPHGEPHRGWPAIVFCHGGGFVFGDLRLSDWACSRVAMTVGAVVVSALLLGVLGFGYGAVPALGPALDPGRGAWTSASGLITPRSMRPASDSGEKPPNTTE